MSEKDKSIKKPKYDTWYDFKRHVIDKAIPEINEKSDVHVEYELVKKGQGGKVNKIIFTVKLFKNNEVEKMEMNKEKKLEYIEQADEILESQLGLKDVNNILEAAGYDLDKITRAYKLSKKQSSIHNLTGWLIKAIEHDYPEPVNKKGNKQNDFNRFKQNEYDFIELENELISN